MLERQAAGTQVAKRTAQTVREDICKLSGSLIMKTSECLLFQRSHGGLCHVQQQQEQRQQEQQQHQAFRDSD